MTMCVTLGVGLAALTILAAQPGAGFAADAAHPTVIELFQSQGCSSCPPAAAQRQLSRSRTLWQSWR